MRPILSDYSLGIDLGSNSVGWAIVTPDGVRAAGSRIFDEGVTGDLEQGKEESRNTARRQARQTRKQTERRGRRLRKTYNLLHGAGLLPTPSPGRHEALVALDRELRERHAAQNDGEKQTLPYRLRARALDYALAPDELGRALYHLAQRRGFKSNRRAAPKEDEEESQVKEHIKELRREMESSGARTLGEHFSRTDPTQREKRIRAQWTARDMYEAEFDAICAAQRQHHPAILTDGFVAELREALFFQRPLKPVKPGKCDLEEGELRCPVAHPLNQRRRILEALNNLEVVPPLEAGLPYKIDGEQRATLLEALETEGDLTMAEARKRIGVKGGGRKLNLELGGEKKLTGNRTAAKIREAIGGVWDGLSPDAQAELVEDLRKFEHDQELTAYLERERGWSPEDARMLARVHVEPGYAPLSLKAIRNLLPYLEEGMRFGSARKAAYPEATQAGQVHDALPPVRGERGYFHNLRNPAVERSLTELRKVVNGLVRQYGKPGRIRIEVARDLKNPRKRREEISKRNRENQRGRDRAYELLRKEFPGMRPRRDDIEKYLLWEECGGVCPYTGKCITLNALFSSDAPFEVEHIIPRSRSLDNSFNNKTLAALEINRTKGNRTPHEMFSGNPEEWEAILQRVRRFKSSAAEAKLRRFQMDEVNLEEFVSRQLNDTRYASKLAAEYLGLLYGGTSDADGKKRIHALAGGVTAQLRNAWDLNGILNDGQTTDGGAKLKTRDDHRHHAVDAVVIGLTSDAWVKRLAEASSRAEREHGIGPDIPAPWPDFVPTVRETVDAIVVSHRVNRRVSAKIHDDSLYSKAYFKSVKGKPVEVRRIRKPLSGMSLKEVESIVDPSVREAVLGKLKLDELGNDPKKFNDEKNLPSLRNKNGSPIPIRSARIERVQSVRTIGKGDKERHVSLAANHHLEVFAHLDEEGDETKWDGKLVSMLDAMQRARDKQPVVVRDHGPNTRFKFSLAPGDTIELREEGGSRGLYRVRSVSQEQERGGRQPPPVILFAHLNDARKKKDIIAAGDWGKRTVNRLGELRCRKANVSPIGEVTYARD